MSTNIRDTSTLQGNVSLLNAVLSRNDTDAGVALRLIFGFGLVLACYWATFVSMAAIWWRSDTYAHGMVIIPIVGYMVWMRREHWRHISWGVEPWGLIAACGAAALWFAGFLVDAMVVQQFAVVSLLIAVLVTCIGRAMAWAWAFPLGYLLFMVPAGEGLVPPLQDITAWFTVQGLRITGIPVLWEGLSISIPKGNFKVVEACSGLRYLVASVALGCLFAYLNFRGPWRRLMFIVFAAILPIIANGIRAYGIVMIAHLSNMQAAVGVDHLIYGWLFFGVVIMFMFWVGSFWQEADDVPSKGEQLTIKPKKSAGFQGWLTVAVLAVVISSGPISRWWLYSGETVHLPPLQAATAPTGWQGPELLGDNPVWTPQFQGADSVLLTRYETSSGPVDLYIARYAYQEQDAELINTQNLWYDPEQWRYTGSEARTATVGSQAWSIREITLDAFGQKRLVWHWYQIAGYRTLSSIKGKLYKALDQIFSLQQGSFAIALSTPYEIHSDEGRGRLNTFLEDFQEVFSGLTLDESTE